MADPFVAEIRIFPFNFAPKGWAFCNGQLLPLSQNTALFSLLGTTYGGDGKSTFALPNLQGSAPIHAGQGPGLSLYDLGQEGGSETVTLLQTEMPSHPHSMLSAPTIVAADSDICTGNSMGKSSQGNVYSPFSAPSAVQLSPSALAVAGSSLPHNNMMPYLTLNFNIALQGVFPARP
jgi:microcystin-dependent protein